VTVRPLPAHRLRHVNFGNLRKTDGTFHALQPNVDIHPSAHHDAGAWTAPCSRVRKAGFDDFRIRRRGKTVLGPLAAAEDGSHAPPTKSGAFLCPMQQPFISDQAMNNTSANTPHIVTLVLLSGLSVASVNLFVPSLPSIASEFGVDYGLANLSVAAYAVVAAVLQLVVGPLSDRFGRRPILLTGLAVFAVASAGCLLATDFATFLCFRMLQAGIVSGFAVSRAVISDSHEARTAASLMGYLAMAWAVAPMLGPVAGGFLDALFGWRANFWAFLSFGIGMLALCCFDLCETNHTRSETLLTQLYAYPELLRSGRFWGFALCTAFSTGAFYAFLGGAPLVASAVFHVPPAMLGVYIGSITAGFVLGSFVAGQVAGRYDLTTMMIAGRLIPCVGLSLGLLLLFAGILHELTLFGACLCLGIGNGVTMPSANSGAMAVQPKLAGSASGLSGALAGISGAATSAFTGASLTADNAASGLLAVMLLAAALGLAAAVYVRWLDRLRR
jgi:MFS transporter, DHA1 family, multidrug resistance protein